MTDDPKNPKNPANPATPEEKRARAARAANRIRAEIEQEENPAAPPANPPTPAKPAANPDLAERIAALKASVARDIGFFERGEQQPEFEEAQEPDEIINDNVDPDPQKPNGHDQQPPPYEDEDALEVVDIGKMSEEPIPPRKFLDGHKFLLMHTTHVLAGDGGAGKTEQVLQMMIGCCGHGKWAKLPIEQGPALFFSAEEPVNEIRRRVHHLCGCMQIHPSALKGLHVIDATEKSAWLFEEDLKTKRMRTTARWEWFVGKIALIRPKLVIIDNRMRIFAGNQNDSIMAVTVIAMLDRIARLYDCVIVLVSHPSLSQMSSGRGDSGSVAWSNAARSRSYLHHPELDRNLITDGDDGQRRLTSMKANATKAGLSIDFFWHEGLGFFDCAYEAPRADEAIGLDDKAERVFLKLLAWHTKNSMSVAITKGPRYAPKLFAAHEGCERLVTKHFVKAMHSLLDRGAIRSVPTGPPSDNKSKLVLNS